MSFRLAYFYMLGSKWMTNKKRAFGYTFPFYVSTKLIKLLMGIRWSKQLWKHQHTKCYTCSKLAIKTSYVWYFYCCPPKHLPREMLEVRPHQLPFTCSKSTIKHYKKCGRCSKSTIKTTDRRHWHRSGVYIVNFEYFHLFLVFLLWNLNKYMLAGSSLNLKLFLRSRNDRER